MSATTFPATTQYDPNKPVPTVKLFATLGVVVLLVIVKTMIGWLIPTALNIDLCPISGSD